MNCLEVCNGSIPGAINTLLNKLCLRSIGTFPLADINKTNPGNLRKEIGRHDTSSFTVSSAHPPPHVSFCRMGISGRSRSPETDLQDEASLPSVGSVGSVRRREDRAFGGGGLV